MTPLRTLALAAGLAAPLLAHADWLVGVAGPFTGQYASAGDQIKLTSSALVLEQLIGKFMLNAAEKPASTSDSQ